MDIKRRLGRTPQPFDRHVPEKAKMGILSWADGPPQVAAANQPAHGRNRSSTFEPLLLAAGLALSGAAFLASHFALTGPTLTPAPPPASEKPAANPSAIGNSSEPIDVEAEKLDHGRQERETVYTGDVVAVQGLARLRTPKLTVYAAPPDPNAAKPPPGFTQGDGGKIERMEAEGPVHYTTPTERVLADHGAYLADGDTITLTGHVVLLQGKTVGTGDKLVIEKKTGHYTLTSDPGLGASHRVRSVLYPGQSSSSQTGENQTDRTAGPPNPEHHR